MPEIPTTDQQQRMNSWVGSTCQRRDKRPHGEAHDRDAMRIDVWPRTQIRDGLHNIGDHESAHARAHRGNIDHLVVLASVDLVLVVALSFADRVVGQYDRSGTRVENSRVVGVPARLIATVSVDDNNGWHLPLWRNRRTIDVCRNSQTILGAIRDSLNDNPRGSSEVAVGFRRYCGQRIWDKECVAYLLTPEVDLLISSNLRT